jgi:ELWxxDGT repeat protein
MIKDIRSGSAQSWPHPLTNANGTLFFTADDGTHDDELWKSDGTAAGTTMVKDINPDGSSQDSDASMINVGGTLFFSANDGVAHNEELWKTDGTEAGTTLVKDIWPDMGPGAESSSPGQLTNVDSTLFFAAQDGTRGRELWKSDGTAAGTTLVKNIDRGSGDSWPWDLTNVDGTLFFRANDLSHGEELWKSDGTEGGTRLVEDIAPSARSNPDELTNVDGTAFFSADDGAHGRELWQSDGTAAGTRMVEDIRTRTEQQCGFLQCVEVPGSSAPSDLTNVNGALFFSANDGCHGSELWKAVKDSAAPAVDSCRGGDGEDGGDGGGSGGGGGGGSGGGGGVANDFSFGKVKKNKRKGTAKLTVKVPGSGELELAKTKKVKPDDESAEDAGKEKLAIKPKGKARKRLNKKGKAKVNAEVTYTPEGGEPSTQSKKVKLVKR